MSIMKTIFSKIWSVTILSFLLFILQTKFWNEQQILSLVTLFCTCYGLQKETSDQHCSLVYRSGSVGDFVARREIESVPEVDFS